MQQELASGLLAIYFGVSVFAACTVIHKVQGLLRNDKDISCHSLRTWLIPRDSFMMLRTFQAC